VTGHDHFEDVGAYLLGALSDAERAAFEAEMERSPALREEVDYLRVAADALPASAPQMAPPPDLKDRIMAVVDAEAALLNAAHPEPRRRRRTLAVLKPGWWSLRPGLALAMTLLVLVVGAGGGLLASSALDDDERVIVAAVGDATLIERESGHSTLTVRNLEAPGFRRVYQVWLKHEGRPPVPTDALFSTSAGGTASVDVPGSLDEVEAVMVTNEPEGGSEAPTTEPVIIARPA
jgi:anti-sigma-K factor RskA